MHAVCFDFCRCRRRLSPEPPAQCVCGFVESSRASSARYRNRCSPPQRAARFHFQRSPSAPPLVSRASLLVYAPRCFALVSHPFRRLPRPSRLPYAARVSIARASCPNLSFSLLWSRAVAFSLLASVCPALHRATHHARGAPHRATHHTRGALPAMSFVLYDTRPSRDPIFPVHRLAGVVAHTLPAAAVLAGAVTEGGLGGGTQSLRRRRSG